MADGGCMDTEREANESNSLPRQDVHLKNLYSCIIYILYLIYSFCNSFENNSEYFAGIIKIVNFIESWGILKGFLKSCQQIRKLHLLECPARILL